MLVVALSSSTVLAQPGQTQPAPPQPYPAPAQPQPYPPQPYPPPQQPYVPPPQQYQPQPIQITAEEHDLLLQGEITDGQIVGGGVLSLLVGFGVGQGVQGRWSDTGWIFTLGETASITMMLVGAVSAIDDGFDDDQFDDDDEDFEVALIVTGAIGFVGFRVWEIVDAFAGPASHNDRVRRLRMRIGYPPAAPYYGATPFIAPAKHGDGGVAGFTLRF